MILLSDLSATSVGGHTAQLRFGWRQAITGAAVGTAVGACAVIAIERFGYLAPILAVTGVGFAWLAFLRLEISLVPLLVSSVLFDREVLFQPSIPFFGGGLKVPDVLLLLVFCGFATRRLLDRGKLSPPPRAMTALVCGFVGWAMLEAVLGTAYGHAYKESLLELRPLLQYLLFIPIVLELRPAAIKRLIGLVLGCATLMGIRAVVLYAAGIGSSASYTSAGIRVMDFEFSYLLFAVLLAAALAFEGRRHRWLLLGVIAACMAGLTVTFYREAFLALLVGAGFLMLNLTRPGRRRLTAMAAAFGPVAAVAVLMILLVRPALLTPLADLTTRIGSIGAFGRDVSAVHRLREWKAAARLIAMHPVTGNGLGARVRFYSPMYDQTTHRMGYLSNNIYIHNSYVWIVTKMGAIGAILFWGMLIAAGHHGFRLLRTSVSEEQRGLALGLMACLGALLVVALFGPQFNAPNVTPFVGFALGALFALGPPQPAPEQSTGAT